MLHGVLFILVGLVGFWLLAAIFEAIALKDHPNLARVLAAAVVLVSACIGGGYRNWWEVLIGIGAAFFYLQILRESRPQSEKESAVRNSRLKPAARYYPAASVRCRTEGYAPSTLRYVRKVRSTRDSPRHQAI